MWRKLLEACLFGILEGITEWLPISSTGHLILLRRYLHSSFDNDFFELFEVVIQLGAILAVLVVFFDTLCPLFGENTAERRRSARALWARLCLALLPSALVGFLFDDLLDAYFYRASSVAAALILYGILFLLVDRRGREELPSLGAAQVSTRKAFCVGCFQVLSLLPGTSRSGSTILGGMLVGLSRSDAAAFSFLLGVPTMMGASLLKGVKFFAEGGVLVPEEWAALAVGTLTAFLVSLVTVRFLCDFVRKHTFAPFGVYRILLGCAVLADAWWHR
ncbi:MAG: undecaprenyl-diphosphate phosphatase [Ruminococcaceae bacterium]|nr:undecaprenyl-diphosphate phosphatase [Oscillospiraceae bacterium]